MKSQFEKNAGIALLLFVILMVFTMVLHPVGGSFDYLLRVTRRIVISHSIALVSIPFAGIVFWGLTRRIGSDNFFSVSAYALACFALIAATIAATTNGLILPVFIEKYKDASADMVESLKPILKYNFSVNLAFDYLYMGGFCLAMLFWSVAILNTKKFPLWVAYFGIGLSLLAAILSVAGIAFSGLNGFRMFVIGIVTWILMVAFVLIRKTESQ